MTNTIQLEVTEQELISILYALQDRSNALRERIKDNQRVDIDHILQRQFKDNTKALAYIENTIEVSV